MPWGCASVSCPSAFAMLHDASASVLLIVSADELNWNSRVWGTGGWMPPEGREALDWLTLARLLGWEVDVCDVNLSGRLATRMTPSARVIIIACDPESLGEEAVDIISSRLANEQILVVTRVARQGCAFAKSLRGIRRGRFGRHPDDRVARTGTSADDSLQDAISGAQTIRGRRADLGCCRRSAGGCRPCMRSRRRGNARLSPKRDSRCSPGGYSAHQESL